MANEVQFQDSAMFSGERSCHCERSVAIPSPPRDCFGTIVPRNDVVEQVKLLLGFRLCNDSMKRAIDISGFDLT
jgi:hypothetical protein